LARLERLAGLIRLVVTVQRLAWFLAGGLVALATVIAVDYALWLPWWARAVALMMFVGGGVIYARKWLLPALRFRPSPEQLALRVERTEAGQRAGLAGVLASGIGLRGSATGLEQALAAPVIERAGRLLERLPLRSVVNVRQAAASLCVLALLVLVSLVVLLTRPTLTLIGLERALLPISSASWPKTEDLRDITGVRVHALGQALALRVAMVKGAGAGGPLGVGPGVSAAQVVAHWRVLRDGRAGPERSLGASYQGKSVDVPPRDELDTLREPSGPLFERLIEPATLAAELSDDGVSRAASLAGRIELEYWFSGRRDRTEPVRIAIIPPPVVVGARVIVEPPAYAPGLGARSVDAGPGDDERALVSGILPGSMVSLELTFNKPVPSAWLSGAPTSAASTSTALNVPEAELRTRFGPDVALLRRDANSGLDLKLSEVPAGPHATLRWRHAGTVRVRAMPRDEHGLEPTNPGVFVLELRADKPPEAVVTEPALDTQALPGAELALAGQASDDVALAWTELRVQVAQAQGDSSSGLVEPVGEDRALSRVEGAGPEAGVTISGAAGASGKASGGASGGANGGATARLESRLKLSELSVKPGQEVWISVLAKDTFSLDGREHEAVRSPLRKVRIISADQLLEQLWGELSGVRRQVQRLAERQAELKDLSARGADPARAAREQPELAEQIGRAEQALARVRQALGDNALSDEEMAGVVRDARAGLTQAQRSAAQAGASAQTQQRERAAGDQAGADAARREAGAQQEQAQAALEQAAEALDRGQDTWAARKSIERLIAEQRELRAQSAAIGEAHAGKTPEQLPEATQREVRELADRQEQLARRTDEAVRKLDQRAEQAQKTDPASADALREAARQGRQGGASDQMQQAARSARQNQQQSAQQAQAKAEQALQRALSPLQDQAKARDAVLRRVIASLIEAIDALIGQQERATAGLKRAMPAGPFAGIDGPMVRLHAGTTAATQQARDAGRSARPVVAPLEAARDQQMVAVTALRG